MFTGIIEETGKVVSFVEQERAWRLTLEASTVVGDLKPGDSVACNGCCLTAVEVGADRIGFDLLGETVKLTSFDGLRPGDLVNLERALLPTTRMGGHFVSGHVDALGRIATIEPRGKDSYMRIEPPAEFLKYLVYKGSITVDGISLTVAAVVDGAFEIWLIPHTMEVTNLHSKRPGDTVNLEFDLIGKYVEKLMGQR